MSKNNSAFTNIGIFDSGFGFLASLCAIKEQICKNPRDPYNVNELIIRTRQIMGLLESSCGPEYDSKKQTLYNLTKPDFLLFKEKITDGNIPEFIHKIKEKLDPFFLKCHPPSKSNGCWGVETIHKAKKSKIHLVESFLNLQNKIANERYMIHESTIKKDDDFQTRIIITSALLVRLEKFSFDKFINKKPIGIKNILSKYQVKIILPLVGTIRKHQISDHEPNIAEDYHQRVLYFMTCYENTENKNLDKIEKELDYLIPSMLEEPELRELIAESASKCKPGSNQYYVSKLLARPKGSDTICILYFVAFNRMILDAHILPIRDLYSYAARKLKWDVWMNRRNICSFPLKQRDFE